MPVVSPATTQDLRDAVCDAARNGDRLEIRGGGTKSPFGAPRTSTILDMTRFAEIIDYDPAELVLTVGAGAALSEIQTLLASRGQALAFDPFDAAPLFGTTPGRSTIGGVVAAAVAGPRRLSRGAARDHLLGFKGVSGRAEALVGGSKVVKNVTGYDLPKLVCDSWGRIAAVTEVSLKVLPAPVETATLALGPVPAAVAVVLMSKAMGSQGDVAAAAFLPVGPDFFEGTALLKIEGFGPSVAARRALLERLLTTHAPSITTLEPGPAAALWADLGAARPLTAAPVLWRIHVRPSRAPALLAAKELAGRPYLLDWAGGLVWLAFDGDAAIVRRLAASEGGQATLVRAPEPMRRATPALHPAPSGAAALAARVRRAFDPAGVFETGRFLDAPHAD